MIINNVLTTLCRQTWVRGIQFSYTLGFQLPTIVVPEQIKILTRGLLRSLAGIPVYLYANLK